MSEMSRVPLSSINPEQTTKGLTPRLQQLPTDHLLLVSDNNEIIASSATAAALTSREDYKVGRDDSLQKVHFADLSALGENETLSTQPIAIKPFDVEWLATRDYRTAVQLNKDGHITFEPIGFLRKKDEQGKDKICTITKFEQGVTSCDNILWGDREHQRPADSSISLALSVAAQSLMILHDQGLQHGDFQVKNTAYDITQQPRIIDLTDVKKQSDPYKFGEDLSLYLSSLSRYGKQAPYPTEEQVEDLFLRPYHNQIDNIFPYSKRQTMHEIVACLAINISDVMNDRY
jgi:hypothetical protein